MLHHTVIYDDYIQKKKTQQHNIFEYIMKCVSLVLPGGTLGVGRSLDLNVPHGEHCVHLLHI